MIALFIRLGLSGAVRAWSAAAFQASRIKQCHFIELK